jgi:hypothetical protein
MSTTNDKAASLAGWIFVILMLPAVWLNAYALLVNYNRFLLPVQGAPHLVLGNMIGVALICALLTAGLKRKDASEKYKDNWAAIFLFGICEIIIVPLGSLFFGWIFQMIFMR